MSDTEKFRYCIEYLTENTWICEATSAMQALESFIAWHKQVKPQGEVKCLTKFQREDI